MYLQGRSQNAVDDKGRVLLPVKMRRALMGDDERDPVYMTRGFEDCLAVYPRKRWDDLQAMISDLNPFDPRARAFTRLFVGDSEEVFPDGQKRVKLPAFLREMAGIEDKVLVVGTGDRIELWNPERYEAKLNEEIDYSSLASEVMVGAPPLAA